jgi:predicted GIY-YIG superfamily endonuclease
MSVQGEIEIDGDATALYRLYGAEGDLLYVGVTRNISVRFNQHQVTKSWWPDVRRKTMTWYGSRAAARAAESAVVVAEKPRYNRDEPTAEYSYVKIVNHVKARVAAGELASGARLPNERDMAAEYGVALSTLRRALVALRDQDVVVTVPIKGTFIVREQAQ